MYQYKFCHGVEIIYDHALYFIHNIPINEQYNPIQFQNSFDFYEYNWLKIL